MKKKENYVDEIIIWVDLAKEMKTVGFSSKDVERFLVPIEEIIYEKPQS